MARQWEGHGYFPWAVRWGGPGSHYSLPGYSWAISTCDCNLSQSVWCHFTCSLCPEDLWCATWLWSRIMESKIWLDSHFDFLAWSQYTQNKSIWGSRPKPMTLEGGMRSTHFQRHFPVSMDTLEIQTPSLHRSTRCRENSFLLTDFALLQFLF